MSYTTPTYILKSKKLHKCSWCGQAILIDTPYFRFRSFYDGDASTVKLHPECKYALDNMDWTCYDEWHEGQMKRGESCYEYE